LGKLTILGAIGILGHPPFDAALKSIIGNRNAEVQRFRRFGPIRAGVDIAQSLAGMDGQQRGVVQDLASFITFSPVIQRGVESYYNRDMFTGQQLVNPYSTPLGKGVQAGEAAAGAIYPLRLGMQAAKQGPGALAPLVGARLPQHPPGYVPPKVRQIERGKARSRERHDPVEGGVHKIIDAIGSITSSPP